jgi:hypothetical protein
VTLPDSDPIQRLAFFIGKAEKSPSAALMKTLTERLQEEKFPVTEKPLGDDSRDFTADELTELGRWIDSLDRI